MTVTENAEATLTARFGIRIAVRIPYRGQGVTGAGIIRVAQAAEAAGFHAGFVGDHVVWPAIPPSQYPPTRPGVTDPGYPHAVDELQLEAMTVLSFASAVTTRLKLATGVLIAGYRSPVLLAKQVATLDYLAEGRVLIGVGTGWLEQEFQALGIPFKDRGGRLDETIEILRRCWSDPAPEFHGRYWDFGPLIFNPQPRSPVPIWFGGHTERAWRRAIRLGDGWLHSSTALFDVKTVIASAAAERPEGMSPLEIGLSHKIKAGEERGAVDAIERLRDEGVSLVVIAPWYDDESPAALMRLIDRVAG